MLPVIIILGLISLLGVKHSLDLINHQKRKSRKRQRMIEEFEKESPQKLK